MMQYDDNQLINRILDGAVQEYSILINRHKDLAFTLAYRLLSNREDAEETVQDAFVKAYRNLKGFRQDSKFSTWFFRIVYNTAISKKRSRKSTFQWIDELPFVKESPDRSSEEEDMMAERGSMLDRALQRLSEDERVLITLFYINESTVEEIHGITGLSKSNIKVKLFRARKKLQDLVELMAQRVYI
ncbi:MAG: RNA polymerase sigma factor [Bacteroidales bacterium]|nr:RNA polymerase sigma factor [Bacteroidales bacterium]